MPVDFLPAIYPIDGVGYRNDEAEESLYNCIPWVLNNGVIGACPRHEFGKSGVPTSASDRGRGVYAWGNYYVVFVEEEDYTYDGGTQDLTATTGNGYAGNTGFNEEYIATFVRHAVSGVENMVIVNAGHTSTHASANHGNVWYVADSTTAPSSVSDADLPCNNGVSIIRGGASLDGYFFVGDINGKIYNSDLNDITSWTATNFITAERQPDIGIYLGKHHDHIVYIGTRSIEFFYNAGNPSGSPLSRRSDIQYNIGCYFPNSVVEVGDVIYFVGNTHDNESKVYKLENFQLTAISSPKVNRRLREMSGGNAPDITDLDPLYDHVWMARTVERDGPGLILTYGVSNGFTYYWNEPVNIWSSWAFGASVTYYGGTQNGSWLSLFPVVASAGLGNNAANYQMTNKWRISSGDADNDAINDFNESNGVTPFIQFPRWDGGTDKKKRITSVRILTEPVATANPDNNPLQVELAWFDYDRLSGVNGPSPLVDGDYTGDRSIELNVRGARVYRCGTTRERSFILNWTVGHGPVSVVKGLEIEYEVVE